MDSSPCGPTKAPPPDDALPIFEQFPGPKGWGIRDTMCEDGEFQSGDEVSETAFSRSSF